MVRIFWGWGFLGIWWLGFPFYWYPFGLVGTLFLGCGIATDLYKIYNAQDKLKATVSSAGGWAGAMGMGAIFAAWWTPADVAGPGAWIVHGVGTLIAGGVGYFVGSEATTYIYELIVEE